ncbi:glycosyltransferase [Candidatus Parcubacteria bacterium]|nr:glycosyltransferase [Candidatus Parcubacteria bacterium]
MERKKIVYLITKGNWGGAQRYVYDLAVHFTKENDVLVVTGAPGTLTERLSAAGVRTKSVLGLRRDVSFLDEFRSFFAILKIVRDERPDILHVNSSKAAGFGALAGRLARVPRIVFTAHGWAFNEPRPLWEIGLIYFLSWMTVLLAHRTITVSERDAKEARTFPFAGNRISTVYLGIEAPRFTSRVTARKTLLAESAVSSGRGAYWIGMIGELTRNKGYRYALDAFAELSQEAPNALLAIVGEGEERASLERYIARAGLSDRVLLAGFRPAEAVLCAFDAFLMSSVKEGLPYVLLEAAHAKLPVVATEVGGIPEIIASMSSGMLVPPNNPHALARALATLIAKKKVAAEMGEKLSAWVTTEFTIEKMLEKTSAVYGR